MMYLLILALILAFYTKKVDFDKPLSVALWCVVMLLFWVAAIYAGMTYALIG